MHCTRRSRRVETAHPGFSLVELIVVVTIIGIIAAIAVPRFSTVTTRATSEALKATVAHVSKSSDCYYAEHDHYPGYDPGNGPPNGEKFVEQLTMYTSAAGVPSETYGSPHVYGPYLRKPFPANPFNLLSTVHVKAASNAPDPAEGSVGWVAVLSHGYFGVSASDADLDKVGVNGADEKASVRGLFTN